jgi:16S rRNA (guanine527-N7)-methyltransferase
LSAEHRFPYAAAPTLLFQEAGRLGLSLNAAQLDLFQRYYQELLAWNERVNLTTIVEWEAVQVQHLLDSLACALVLPAAARQSPYAIVDVGAGAGFPGLPLRILLPQSRLTLIESVGKKAAFLRHVTALLRLDRVEVLAVRAEEAGRDPAHRQAYDLAVARAVATMATLAEYCLPLVRPGGLLVAQKGREVEEEVSAAGPALQILGGRLREVRPVQLPGLESPRHLVVVEKVQPTPERFPRRPGLPAKRPLR